MLAMFKKIVIIATVFLGAFSLSAEEVSSDEFSFSNDFYDSLKMLGKGSYLQFTDAPSIFLGGAGAVTLAAAFFQKETIENEIRSKKASDSEVIISDLNIIFSLPIIPLGTWLIAKKTDNQKLRSFAKEYFATLYLTKAEVFTLSFIPINKRPNSDGINTFEKNFRGKSSFPSGHMVPASTLFWKTFQYYGPLYASIPAAWTITTAYQRVNSKRHHITDVIGTFFLAGMANEGVRVAAAHKNNHPLYKWIFEHRLSFNFFKGKDVIQTTLDFTF